MPPQRRPIVPTPAAWILKSAPSAPLDGAITGRRKLPWRYHTPDSVRDDVLARLLALSAERDEEEMEIGLHSQGVKQAAKAAKRGRKPKTALATATLAAAFELEPEPLQMGLDFSGGC